MKKLKISFLLFLFILVSIGCQDDTCYSCDPETDAWAKNNIEFLKTFGREDLSKLNSSKQKAAYRVFTPEKRKNLWLAKMNQIKSLDFSNSEKKHIQTVEDFIKNYDFSRELTQEQESYLNNWFDEGKINYS